MTLENEYIYTYDERPCFAQASEITGKVAFLTAREAIDYVLEKLKYYIEVGYFSENATALVRSLDKPIWIIPDEVPYREALETIVDLKTEPVRKLHIEYSDHSSFYMVLTRIPLISNKV